MNIMLSIDEEIVERVRKIAMKRFFTSQNILIVLLVSLGVIFLGVVFSDGECIPQLIGLCEKNESLTFKGCISQLLGSSEDNKRKTLTFIGIGMGGVLVALQALASHKRAKAMEDTANAQADATREQAKANKHTEQGQRQERLKDAIEHLGHKSVSVRLGGAYELFHLAADATEDAKKLRQTVLDILCAHIRQTTGESEYRKTYKSKPSEEIQSLLTLLFVQDHKVFKGLHTNLQGSWLNGTNLQDARLENIVLDGAYLRRTNLRKARLQGARLQEACLQGAVLWEAHLQGSTLRSARLQGGTLRVVQLQGADLSGAHLQGADLPGAQLQGAELLGAQLQGADLYAADLRGVVSQFRDLKKQFEERITNRTKRKDDLNGAIFEGGLSQEYLDSLVEGFSDEETTEFRMKMRGHLDNPASHKLPENSGAIRGKYTKEEAEQWIAEYNEATKDIED